jgi:hypothetical protein
MPPRQVTELLNRENVPYEVLPHLRTYTAQYAAAALT